MPPTDSAGDNSNPNDGNSYSDDELIEYIHEYVDEHGHVPTMDAMGGDRPSQTAFITHFGTWNNAIRAAGFRPNRQTFTDEDLLSWIETFVDEFDRLPYREELGNWPGPSATTYHRRFGSWTEAVEAAGYEPRARASHQTYTDGDLLDALRAFAETHGRTPTPTDFIGERPSTSTFRSRFGSFWDALDAAGLEIGDSEHEVDDAD